MRPTTAIDLSSNRHLRWIFPLVIFLTTPSLAREPHKPWIVAHRGLLRHAPENTLANFRACLELRLGFEMDVRRTEDGKLICIHDETVDRTTDGYGKVAELTLREIQQLDAGGWYEKRFSGESAPSIDQVLQLASQYRKNQFLIAVDLKVNGAEAELVALAKHHHVLDKLLFIGNTISDTATRAKLREASAKAAIAVVAHNNEELEKALEDKHANWIYFRYLPDAQRMKSVRAKSRRSFIAGKLVAGDMPKNWMHAAGVGIDAILTDYPLRLRETQRFADQ